MHDIKDKIQENWLKVVHFVLYDWWWCKLFFSQYFSSKRNPCRLGNNANNVDENSAWMTHHTKWWEACSRQCSQLYTCIRVADASSSVNCNISSAQSWTWPKADFCLSASRKTESRYKNLCQILWTLANL